jgi:hypothetical protein
VPLPCVGVGAAASQACGGVGPEALQQPVAGRVATGGGHQRLVHQRWQHPDHAVAAGAAGGTDRLDRVVVEVGREYPQPVEQGALLVAEQVIAPVDRGPQRAVPRQSRAGTGRQQLEALVKEFQERGWREAAHAGGRQLDRQRQPIQPLAQRRHRRGVGVGQRKARRGVRGTVDEQAHGVVPGSGGRPGRCLPAGNGQRLDLVADLAGDAEDLPAGGQHPQLVTSRQQVRDDRSGLGDHVLAVVDQQQTLQLAGCVAEAVPHRAGRLGADAE